MKRRSFLRKASLLPLPMVLSQFRLSALDQPLLASQMVPDDRVLVLIQLDGGNDGLNTVVPLDQYDGLMAVRQNIVTPANRLLKVENSLALHSNMEGLQNLYKDGKVGIVQSVGYPQQNRSHFRSTDIWNTASASDEVITTGWLGRHLDENNPGFPGDFPNTDKPDPFAIVVGNSVSETCQGRAGNFSIAINNIDNVGQLPSFAAGVDTNTPYGKELDWLRQTIVQSNEYATTIEGAVAGANTIVEYPEGNPLAAKLRQVARLISGGLGTKIYIVQLGGFDTHANQTPAGAPATGTHAGLVGTVSAAVAAFQSDLAALGLEERVMGMTYSEFGRQVKSNASQGTDHGDAAPLFLFGSCVSAGVTGQNVEVDPMTDTGEGVPMQYDFRNVYGSVLMDWFGVPENTVSDLIIDDFNYVPLVAGCSTTPTSNRDLDDSAGIMLSAAPNPFREQFEIAFNAPTTERVRVTLFNGVGQEVRVITDRTLTTGQHRVPVSLRNMPSGTYFIHLKMAGGLRRTKRVVKTN